MLDENGGLIVRLYCLSRKNNLYFSSHLKYRISILIKALQMPMSGHPYQRRGRVREDKKYLVWMVLCL